MKKKIFCYSFMVSILLMSQALAASASAMIGNHVERTDSLNVDTLDMKVMVPAYFSPSSSSYWNRLDSQAAKMPGRLYAIANVYNGPGTSYRLFLRCSY